ncbi:MAG: YhcB family protein [Gammaproteobacteria bacterium]|nr:YhcB family protein [Gammaproteobacteria bacterium]
MEAENSIWLVGVFALTAGVLIGALAYRLFATSVKDVDKVKAELNEARQELDQYKSGVTQHFDKTAELVNDLAQNYVKVYQHLAEGAQTLGASKSFKDLIEQHQDKAAIALDDQPEITETAEDSSEPPKSIT